MKINWGTGIVIAIVAFISFILFFVLKMTLDNRSNHELVREDYYKAELGFQDEIDAQNNANENKVRLTAEMVPEGVLIKFPKDLDHKNIEGTVSLYRPSNKHLDFDLPLSLSQDYLLIPDNRLLDGRWDIKVFWEYKGEAYLFKDKVTYTKGKE